MVTEIFSGRLHKMLVEQDNPVKYSLQQGDQCVSINDLLGQHLTLTYSGEIFCTHCQRKTKKSFNQGYCYPCFTRLAQCDSCIISPEKCHYDQGSCREPEWADQHCMVDHVVYLANSSGLKVGITRATQVPTRWIDQGAIQAVPLVRVSTRQQSGLLEDSIRQQVADKTNWRKMLKGEVENIDLKQERDRILDTSYSAIEELQSHFGFSAVQIPDDPEVTSIFYPVERYPQKVVSHNLDKSPVVEGCLEGIKGQYLIFDTGVINIRKFTGYQVNISVQ